MYCSATGDSSHFPLGSWNAFAPFRNSDWWVCIPEPFWPKIGLGMKVERQTCRLQTLGTMERRVVLLMTKPIFGQNGSGMRSEEHTSELQSLAYIVCRLLLEKKK